MIGIKAFADLADPSPERQPIRIVHLANLTSGLPNWLPDPGPRLRDVAPTDCPAAIVALNKGYDRVHFDADLAKVEPLARSSPVSDAFG